MISSFFIDFEKLDNCTKHSLSKAALENGKCRFYIFISRYTIPYVNVEDAIKSGSIEMVDYLVKRKNKIPETMDFKQIKHLNMLLHLRTVHRKFNEVSSKKENNKCYIYSDIPFNILNVIIGKVERINFDTLSYYTLSMIAVLGVSRTVFKKSIKRNLSASFAVVMVSKTPNAFKEKCLRGEIGPEYIIQYKLNMSVYNILNKHCKDITEEQRTDVLDKLSSSKKISREQLVQESNDYIEDHFSRKRLKTEHDSYI